MRDTDVDINDEQLDALDHAEDVDEDAYAGMDLDEVRADLGLDEDE